MERFAARGWPVVFVEKVGIRNPGPRHMGAVLRRLSAGRTGGGERPFHTVSPKLLPPRRAPGAAALNRRWLARQLLPLLEHPSRAVAWIRYPAPELVALVDDMQPRLVVYEAVDEHAESPGLPPRLRRLVAGAESELLERAGLVFAWSEPIRARLAARHANVVLAPAAVDLAAFAEGESQSRTAGYLGSIDGRFDAELVAGLAERLPDWRIVLAGPAVDAAAARRLAGLPNVELPGAVDPQEVPSLLVRMSVCLMPYRVNDFTTTLFPVKLVEYLAAGRPIVSTPIAAVRDFADVVAVQADADGFARAIEQAPDSPDDRARRRGRAAAYGWDRRIAEMEQALRAALG